MSRYPDQIRPAAKYSGIIFLVFQYFIFRAAAVRTNKAFENQKGVPGTDTAAFFAFNSDHAFFFHFSPSCPPGVFRISCLISFVCYS
jgi:hypothetical protein